MEISLDQKICPCLKCVHHDDTHESGHDRGSSFSQGLYAFYMVGLIDQYIGGEGHTKYVGLVYCTRFLSNIIYNVPY